MLKFKNCFLAAGLVSLSFATPSMAATYTLNGTIFTTPSAVPGQPFDPEFDRFGTTIDRWRINAPVDGNYQFDVLSWDVLDGDSVDSLYGPRAGFSGLTSVIRLFNFDPLGELGELGTQVGFNIDGLAAGFGDGSTSFVDSFLDIFLPAGDYVIGIGNRGNVGLSEEDIRADISHSLLFGLSTFADYQITVNAPDVPDLGVIPLPASLPLLAAAFGGFALLRRMRKQVG